MRNCLLFVGMALLLLCGAVMAGQDQVSDSACPANRAAEEGYNPFEAFHSVMAPAWHGAWPEKNYDALIAAAPKFTEIMGEIMKMKPDLNEVRMANFVSHRDDFAKIVNAYAEAAEKGDNEAVYALMPDVHEMFEQTAASLLPIHYPLVESIAMQARLITETHLPKENKQGIVDATDKLVEQVKYLDEDSIPQELSAKKDALLAQFADIRKITAKMKECCDKDDMETFRVHAEALDGRMKVIVQEYL
jgi:hypothetical protein